VNLNWDQMGKGEILNQKVNLKEKMDHSTIFGHLPRFLRRAQSLLHRRLLHQRVLEKPFQSRWGLLHKRQCQGLERQGLKGHHLKMTLADRQSHRGLLHKRQCQGLERQGLEGKGLEGQGLKGHHLKMTLADRQGRKRKATRQRQGLEGHHLKVTLADRQRRNHDRVLENNFQTRQCQGRDHERVLENNFQTRQRQS
jgi:hypothetical protein